MNNNKIELDYGIVELRKDGILSFDYFGNKNNDISVEQMEETLEIYLKLTENKLVPFCIDAPKLFNLTNEQKEFALNTTPMFASALGLVEKSPLTRNLVHVITYFNKPPFPVKMFKTKHEALTWLKQYV